MSIIGISSRWERKAKEIMAREEAPTYVKGEILGRAESKWPRYDVYEFYPDREEFKNEPIIITGPEWSIALQLSLLRAQYQMNGRGESSEDGWVGYPLQEWFRIAPKTGITANIMLGAFKEPPFNRMKFGAGNFSYTIQPRQVSVPWVDVSKLTYQNLRTVCGSVAGLNWGMWQARAYVTKDPNAISKKGLRQIVASGPTERQAETNLDRFVALTTGFEVSRTCTEVKIDKGMRSKNPRYKYLKKYDVYPAWIWFENAELVAADDIIHKGKTTLSGKVVSKRNKLIIWPEREPAGWSSTMRELIRTPLNQSS